MRPAGVAILAILVSLAGTARAVEPSPARQASGPLGLALSMAPATADALASARSYVDFRAVEAARPGAAHPTSFAQLQALRDADDPSARLWMAATMGVDSGSLELLRWLAQYGAEWPAHIGLDFFDIDRELAFGTPPGDGLVLLGRFDPDAVTRAFEARDYNATPVDGRTLLCGPKGCEAGLEADLSQIDSANPFGGALGRLEPLAVSATDILISASVDTLRAMLAAAADPTGSLGSGRADRAAAEVLAIPGPVIQAMFVPPALLDAGLASGLQAGGDAAKQMIEQIAPHFEPIPPYELLAFADGATPTHQVVTIALVYGRAEDALRAVDVMPGRIDLLPSLRFARPLRTLFDDRGIGEVQGEVRTATDGIPVAVLTLRAPLAPSEPGPDGRMVASSLAYRMVVDMVEGRDTLWLAPALPAPP
jgi:hypothetical protein